MSDAELNAHHDGIGEPHSHSTPQTPGPADAANCPSSGPGIHPDPSPGSGAPVSPSERGVGPSLQVGTAWCGIADVRRAARG